LGYEEPGQVNVVQAAHADEGSSCENDEDYDDRSGKVSDYEDENDSDEDYRRGRRQRRDRDNDSDSDDYD
jgi:hypothetical protein